MRIDTGRWSLAVALVAVLAVGRPADTAGQQAIDKAAGDIFGSVMSPFCPGMTLATCPSSQAAALRDDIRAQLSRGASPEEVLDGLYATWGEGVLGPRSALGAGLLAWLVPALVILTAGIGLLVWTRRSSRRHGGVPNGAPAIDPADRRRVEQELARL